MPNLAALLADWVQYFPVTDCGPAGRLPPGPGALLSPLSGNSRWLKPRPVLPLKAPLADAAVHTHRPVELGWVGHSATHQQHRFPNGQVAAGKGFELIDGQLQLAGDIVPVQRGHQGDGIGLFQQGSQLVEVVVKGTGPPLWKSRYRRRGRGRFTAAASKVVTVCPASWAPLAKALASWSLFPPARGLPVTIKTLLLLEKPPSLNC